MAKQDDTPRALKLETKLVRYTPAEKTYLRQLGALIGDLRSAQELSQKRLAEKAGISRNQMNLIETGRSAATLIALRRIAAALGYPAGDLLNRVGPRKQN